MIDGFCNEVFPCRPVPPYLNYRLATDSDLCPANIEVRSGDSSTKFEIPRNGNSFLRRAFVASFRSTGFPLRLLTDVSGNFASFALTPLVRSNIPLACLRTMPLRCSLNFGSEASVLWSFAVRLVWTGMLML
jgi:hypothetical protein